MICKWFIAKHDQEGNGTCTTASRPWGNLGGGGGPRVWLRYCESLYLSQCLKLLLLPKRPGLLKQALLQLQAPQLQHPRPHIPLSRVALLEKIVKTETEQCSEKVKTQHQWETPVEYGANVQIWNVLREENILWIHWIITRLLPCDPLPHIWGQTGHLSSSEPPILAPFSRIERLLLSPSSRKGGRISQSLPEGNLTFKQAANERPTSVVLNRTFLYSLFDFAVCFKVFRRGNDAMAKNNALRFEDIHNSFKGT